MCLQIEFDVLLNFSAGYGSSYYDGGYDQYGYDGSYPRVYG